MIRKRGRVVAIHERRGLVAAEGGAENAVIDECEVVGARDPAALGENGRLGTDLRNHPKDKVVADLHQACRLALAHIRDAPPEHLKIGESPLVRLVR